MGREVKRVPLNFDWAKDKTWKGYVNPFYTATDCPDCESTGETPEARSLTAQWYGNEPFDPTTTGSKPWTPEDEAVRQIAEQKVRKERDFYTRFHSTTNVEEAAHREAIRLCQECFNTWMHHLSQDDVNALVKDGRLMEFTHTFVKGTGWKRKKPSYIPTAREVNIWSLSGISHDGINQSVVLQAAIKRKGIPWKCKKCKGKGILWPTKEAKAKYDNWKREEPPTGEGYQLWQTVSEGSPISPVFATPEQLAHWLTTSPDYRWKRNDAHITRDQWIDFIKNHGWAISGVIENGTVKSGVEYLTEQAK